MARRFKDEELNPDQRAFYEAARAAGYTDCPDHNDPSSTGVGPTPLNNRAGVRVSTAMTYLGHARERPNLTIMPDSLAHRVVFEGRRAVGTVVETEGRTQTVFGHEIVLSSGAIGSPHLLLLSGVGPADHLRHTGIQILHDLPGVGKNLRDHPQVPLYWQTRDDFQQDEIAPPLQITLRYTAAGSPFENDMLLHPRSHAPIWTSSDPLLDLRRADPPIGFGIVDVLNLAAGSGELSLRDADPHVQPFIDYNYLQERSDIDRLREGVHISLALTEHPAFEGIVAERVSPSDADLRSDGSLEEWMMREVNTSHHVSATCKMGPASDPTAVVDQYGRVHGLDGLRVVDASIMPDCIRANTNVTSLAIGERVADFMR